MAKELGWTRYHPAVLALTFSSYALLHVVRKTLSFVKTSVASEWTPSPLATTTGGGGDGDGGGGGDDTWTRGGSLFADEASAEAFLGLLNATFLFVYALGLYVSGALADRLDLRLLLSGGMALSGLALFLFGPVLHWAAAWSQPAYLGLMALNGLLQSTGWPCVVAVMANWFGKNSRGFVLGLWSASPSVGSIVGALLVAAVVDYGYEYAFVVTSSSVMAGSVVVFFGLVTSPREVGLPMPDEEDAEEEKEEEENDGSEQQDARSDESDHHACEVVVHNRRRRKSSYHMLYSPGFVSFETEPDIEEIQSSSVHPPHGEDYFRRKSLPYNFFVSSFFSKTGGRDDASDIDDTAGSDAPQSGARVRYAVDFGDTAKSDAPHNDEARIRYASDLGDTARNPADISGLRTRGLMTPRLHVRRSTDPEPVSLQSWARISGSPHMHTGRDNPAFHRTSLNSVNEQSSQGAEKEEEKKEKEEKEDQEGTKDKGEKDVKRQQRYSQGETGLVPSRCHDLDSETEEDSGISNSENGRAMDVDSCSMDTAAASNTPTSVRFRNGTQPILMTELTEFSNGDVEESRQEVVVPSDGTPSDGGDPADGDAVKPRPKAINFFRAVLLPGVLPYAMAYACLKMVNYVFFFWLPFYLSQAHGLSTAAADQLSIWYDVGGVLGGTVAGVLCVWLDKRALVVTPMLVTGIPVLYVYGTLPAGQSRLVNGVMLTAIGAFISGVSNIISAAISADLGRQDGIRGSQEALSTVAGIIEGTGTLGAAVGQVAVPYLNAAYGWRSVFYLMMAAVSVTVLNILPIVVSEVKETVRRRRGGK